MSRAATSRRFRGITLSVVLAVALMAGAVMQAIFGNPLAEPGVVGVSSGAALGAAAAIVLGLTAFGSWTTAALAFMGALLAVLLVYFVSRSSGRTEVVTLLLTGIAINAFAGAGLALLMFAGDTSSREQIVFWQLGSLNGSRWQEVAIVAVITVIGTAAAALWRMPSTRPMSLTWRTAATRRCRAERRRGCRWRGCSRSTRESCSSMSRLLPST